MKILEKGYIPTAVLLAVAALIWPEPFKALARYIPWMLGMVMFGMGMTLEGKDFRGLGRRLGVIGVVIAAHFVIMPLLGAGVGWALRLDEQSYLGFVLVGCCPSGTASNVITYLAGGSVPLAVSATLISNALAPVMTPMLVSLLAGKVVHIPFWSMVVQIFWIIVFPLLDGLLLRRFLRPVAMRLLPGLPLFSMLMVAIIIAVVMALNRATILAAPWVILLGVIIHNGLGFFLGWLAGRLFGLEEIYSRTIGIEVGMQNSGLGATLANSFFTPAAALPSAIFSLWQNMAGAVLARYWSKSPLKDD